MIQKTNFKPDDKMGVTRKMLPQKEILLMVGICLLVLSAVSSCNSIEPEEIPIPTDSPTPLPTPSATPEWNLVWQDEFDGQSINTQNWVFETGGGGWGNHELQYYTDQAENARVEDGQLIIEAKKETDSTRQYTSARLTTQGLHAWAYGRIEARIKLPSGQGIWSAFWMLGEDFVTTGWPGCGEIDIMENIGDEPYHIYGTLHGPGYSGGNGIGSDYHLPGEAFSEDFHVFAVEWEPGEIRWFVDDVHYNTVKSTQVPGQWVYDHPFFIILNVAVGGDWPGPPDETTEFPQQMLVDYVRVYQSSNPTLALPSSGGEMHVESVILEILEDGQERSGQATVQIFNQDGEPVEGVRVTGGWLGVVKKVDQEMQTDAEGIAGPFISETTTREGEISFCVTAAVGGGHTYVKGDNKQTCAFFEP